LLQIPDDILDDVSDRDHAYDLARVQHWEMAKTAAPLESNTRSGWTVGGGLEYAVGYGWSVKSEFLYVKFDDFTTFTNAPFAVGTVGPRNVKLEDYIWRAALNYKFW
jgi:outer membrane immunogenic protein